MAVYQAFHPTVCSFSAGSVSSSGPCWFRGKYSVFIHVTLGFKFLEALDELHVMTFIESRSADDCC